MADFILQRSRRLKQLHTPTERPQTASNGKIKELVLDFESSLHITHSQTTAKQLQQS